MRKWKQVRRLLHGGREWQEVTGEVMYGWNVSPESGWREKYKWQTHFEWRQQNQSQLYLLMWVSFCIISPLLSLSLLKTILQHVSKTSDGCKPGYSLPPWKPSISIIWDSLNPLRVPFLRINSDVFAHFVAFRATFLQIPQLQVHIIMLCIWTALVGCPCDGLMSSGCCPVI